MHSSEIEKDGEFKETFVSSVSVGHGKSFVLNCSDGFSLWVENESGLPPPSKGEKVRMYGRGIGYPVRGVTTLKVIYSYQSKSQFDQAEKASALQEARERQLCWENGLSDFLRKKDALPNSLQRRMDFFMRSPSWGPQFGAYEMFCCRQAVLIAEHCETDEGIVAFAKKSPSQQLDELPAIGDSHSGNTFYFSCQLASCLIKNPDLTPKMHAAICPLVGCEKGGCWAASEEAKNSRQLKES